MTTADPAGELPVSPRSTLKRKRERGSHRRTTVEAVLDEGLVCHVGIAVDGATFVEPMAYARIGGVLYLNGARANRLLRSVADGADVCVTVTLVDGLVLARSAFHHSMNYRSVMLFGTATEVTEDDEKRAAVSALLEHLVAGRSQDARPPTPAELRATLIVRLPITDGSAKARTDGPVDDEEDLDLGVWAGVLPVWASTGPAVPAADLDDGVPVPEYVSRWRPDRARPSA